MKKEIEKPKSKLKASFEPQPCVGCKIMTYLHSQTAVYKCAWCMTAGLRAAKEDKFKLKRRR